MKCLSLVVLALCLSVALASLTETQYQTAFLRWMRKEGKTYSQTEFHTRYNIFKQNLDRINAWNARKESYKLGLNRFADLTNKEFNTYYKGVKLDVEANPEHLNNVYTHVPLVGDVPKSLNWTSEGIVTGVKDQGQCGSCWTFSTTGSVEGAHAQATGKLVSLSEQNLVDCAGDWGNEGCNGGWMSAAMGYIIQNKGIDTEESYPYEGVDDTCKFNPANIGSTLSGMVNVTSKNETDLMLKVAKGPVSIAIDASAFSFQFYSSGVYWSEECSSTSLDHGVLAAGYGTEGGEDYWIVKNSWGAGWGRYGYILMIRNWENNCGVATAATLPLY